MLESPSLFFGVEKEVGDAILYSHELQIRCDAVIVDLDGESRHNHNY